jgi:hypothetical protein
MLFMLSSLTRTSPLRAAYACHERAEYKEEDRVTRGKICLSYAAYAPNAVAATPPPVRRHAAIRRHVADAARRLPIAFAALPRRRR